MPIAKRKDIGHLTGKIINNGVEKISGVRLSLAGRVAITDKEGNFRFNTVPVGNYTLGLDPASFGLHTVAETPAPYNIEIKPSQTSTIEISMTKSARVEGSIEVEEDERLNQKGYIPVKERIERLVIEASSESEVFRVLTDENGTFRFEDLRPGEWKIKVYPNGLPRGYNLLTPMFNLTLLPGSNEILTVKVQKKARQIQFQKSIKN
jgi:protocatechuate 3,4-dioxygenase beta subunit